MSLMRTAYCGLATQHPQRSRPVALSTPGRSRLTVFAAAKRAEPSREDVNKLKAIILSKVGVPQEDWEGAWNVRGPECNRLALFSEAYVANQLDGLLTELKVAVVRPLACRVPGTMISMAPSEVRLKVKSMAEMLDCSEAEAAKVLSMFRSGLKRPKEVVRERLEALETIGATNNPRKLAQRTVVSRPKVLEQEAKTIKLKIDILRTSAAWCEEWRQELQLMTPSRMDKVATRGVHHMMRLPYLAERKTTGGMTMHNVLDKTTDQWARLYPDFGAWVDKHAEEYADGV